MSVVERLVTAIDSSGKYKRIADNFFDKTKTNNRFRVQDIFHDRNRERHYLVHIYGSILQLAVTNIHFSFSYINFVSFIVLKILARFFQR